MKIGSVFRICNKNRLSLMVVLVMSSILYQIGLLEISDITNYAFTLSSVLFSVSSCIDTYANNNHKEDMMRFVLDTIALAIAIMLPNIRDDRFITLISGCIDSNLLLILALFFMLASQWAAEIKIQDIKNNRGRDK